MKQGLRGKLPESAEDYDQLRRIGERRFRFCFHCKADFTGENVRTPAAWKETQISGMCENCWDELFSEGGP